MRRRFKSVPELDAALHSVSMSESFDSEELHSTKGTPAVAQFGNVCLNPRGFGIVTTDDGQAHYLRPALARALLTGDTVQFYPNPTAMANKLEVKSIVEVSRDPGILLVQVNILPDELELLPDEACFQILRLPPDFVPTAEDVADGDIIAVAVPAYSGLALEGAEIDVEFVKTLGQRSRKGFDLDYALLRFGFHEQMPSGLMEGEFASGVDDRLLTDFTNVPLVTIDGESTLDLDDAVYAFGRQDGTWEVLVAVADVSWYVRDGEPLDDWASKRCTTVYLPGLVTPMLPESLSNGRCSLQQGELRRAVVMTMILDGAGNVTAKSIKRGLIRSAARLTYKQVAKFMAGLGCHYEKPIQDSLDALIDVHRILHARRSLTGMLEFEDPEPSYTETPEGDCLLKWEPRTEAHKLVEEMMLLANRTAASMLVARYGAGLFRHQPEPDAESWEELSKWAAERNVEFPESPCLRSMSFLITTRATHDEQVAASLKVRYAMQPARYVVREAPAPGGHFSLSVEWYTHFTSPIRRYADLLVHRLLLAPPGQTMDPVALMELTRRVEICSDRAQAARMAERRVWDHLKLAAFIKAVPRGTEVSARIVRSTMRGMRVVIQDSQCAAWLPASELLAANCRYEGDNWFGPEVEPSSITQIQPGQIQPGIAELPRRVLHEGASLQVEWIDVSTERPAYPELQVRLTLNGVA